MAQNPIQVTITDDASAAEQAISRVLQLSERNPDLLDYISQIGESPSKLFGVRIDEPLFATNTTIKTIIVPSEMLQQLIYTHSMKEDTSP